MQPQIVQQANQAPQIELQLPPVDPAKVAIDKLKLVTGFSRCHLLYNISGVVSHHQQLIDLYIDYGGPRGFLEEVRLRDIKSENFSRVITYSRQLAGGEFQFKFASITIEPLQAPPAILKIKLSPIIKPPEQQQIELPQAEQQPGQEEEVKVQEGGNDLKIDQNKQDQEEEKIEVIQEQVIHNAPQSDQHEEDLQPGSNQEQNQTNLILERQLLDSMQRESNQTYAEVAQEASQASIHQSEALDIEMQQQELEVYISNKSIEGSTFEQLQQQF
ncbi:hypothetical protein FGO68_gene6286 [Halteria grandinella]|uniref:Uncharacterized protein n=1 Tax=Halteria grandinella TaxID=5974 RepID=A0A8J8NW73_HALGN|nr:hypothetical protein FGO68_gene6286 [Halteria grandinella]